MSDALDRAREKLRQAIAGVAGQRAPRAARPRRDKPAAFKVSVNRVHLDSGGYTRHGEYYGVGPKLWRVESEASGREVHVRAPDRKTARLRGIEELRRYGREQR